MKIKFVTQQSYSPLPGEIIPGKSETRQSDCMSIQDMIDKYYRQGTLTRIYQGANSLTEDEKRVYFEEVSDLDLEDMDLVDQQAFIDEQIAKLTTVAKEKAQVKREARADMQAKLDAGLKAAETSADADVPENPDKPEIA